MSSWFIGELDMRLSEKEYKWNFFVNSTDMALFNLGMTMASISTLLPLYVRNLGGTNFEVGLIPAIANLGWGLPALIGAKYAERYPRKLDLVIRVTAGERLPYLFMALISFFVVELNQQLAMYLIILMLAVATFSMGFLGPPWMSMIEKVINPRQRGSVLAMGSGLGAVAGIGGSVAARQLLQRYEFPHNFGYCFLFASLAFGLSFVFLCLNKEPVDEVRSGQNVTFSEYVRSVGYILKDRNYLNFILDKAVSTFGLSANGFVAVYATKKLLVPDYRVAEFTAILMVSQAVASFWLGLLGDKNGHKISLLIGKIAQISAMIILLFSSNIVLTYFVFAFLGIVNSSGNVSSLALTIDLVSGKRKELYVGVQNFVLSPISFVAPLICGFLADWLGYHALFVFSTVMTTVSTVFLAIFVSDPRRSLR